MRPPLFTFHKHLAEEWGFRGFRYKYWHQDNSGEDVLYCKTRRDAENAIFLLNANSSEDDYYELKHQTPEGDIVKSKETLITVQEMSEGVLVVIGDNNTGEIRHMILDRPHPAPTLSVTVIEYDPGPATTGDAPNTFREFDEEHVTLKQYGFRVGPGAVLVNAGHSKHMKRWFVSDEKRRITRA